jgi:hypothetical protein
MGAGPLVVTYPLTGRSRAMAVRKLAATNAANNVRGGFTSGALPFAAIFAPAGYRPALITRDQTPPLDKP